VDGELTYKIIREDESGDEDRDEDNEERREL
jgi:hypothetical protein